MTAQQARRRRRPAEPEPARARVVARGRSTRPEWIRRCAAPPKPRCWRAPARAREQPLPREAAKVARVRLRLLPERAPRARLGRFLLDAKPGGLRRSQEPVPALRPLPGAQEAEAQQPEAAVAEALRERVLLEAPPAQGPG